MENWKHIRSGILIGAAMSIAVVVIVSLAFNKPPTKPPVSPYKKTSDSLFHVVDSVVANAELWKYERDSILKSLVISNSKNKKLINENNKLRSSIDDMPVDGVIEYWTDELYQDNP